MATFTPDNGDGIAVLDPVTDAWAREGYGVVDVAGGDCAVTVDSGTIGNADTLSLAAGTILHNGSTVSVSQQSVQIGSADASDPRKDTVWIDSGGNVQVTSGTAASAAPSGRTREKTYDPAAPIPSTAPAVVCAEVWVGAAETTLVADDLRDRRVSTDRKTHTATIEQIEGAVTSNSTLTKIDGDNLTIGPSGELNAAGGSSTGYREIGVHGYPTLDAGAPETEIDGFDGQTGVTYQIKTVMVRLQGGGTNSDITVKVYDGSTSGSVLESTTAGTSLFDLSTNATQGNALVVTWESADGNDQSVTVVVEFDEV